jgi:regulator of RNase E activity RraA
MAAADPLSRPEGLSDEARVAYGYVSTASITTQLLRRGLRNTFLFGLRPSNPSCFRFAGEAFTMRCIPAREDLDALSVYDDYNHPQRVAVESVPPDAVLVIDARGQTRAASLGHILATRLRRRGVAGLVTDGSLRDMHGFEQLELPTFSAGVSATTNLVLHHVVDSQLPIACAEVAVYPGDIMVADRDGVVCVPRAIAEEVARDSLEQEKLEQFVLERIDQGHPLRGTYPPDAETRALYLSQATRTEWGRLPDGAPERASCEAGTSTPRTADRPDDVKGSGHLPPKVAESRVRIWVYTIRKRLGPQAGDLAGDDGLHDLARAAVGSGDAQLCEPLGDQHPLKQVRTGYPVGSSYPRSSVEQFSDGLVLQPDPLDVRNRGHVPRTRHPRRRRMRERHHAPTQGRRDKGRRHRARAPVRSLSRRLILPSACTSGGEKEEKDRTGQLRATRGDNGPQCERRAVDRTMVRLSPSAGCMAASHRRRSRARLMSGRRCEGSSGGQGMNLTGEADPVRPRIRVAICRTVISVSLPMLTGPG